MIEEIWKDIEGYESKYQVSNLGRVRSLNYNREKQIKILKPKINRYGYQELSLYKNSKKKFYTIHRLVAKSFLSNQNNLPQVNHKDEDKTNNCVENLEWCTSEYNINFGTRNRKVRTKQSGELNPMFGKFGKKHHNSKQVNQHNINGEFIRCWDCVTDIERELGFLQSSISNCANGKTKSSYGFIWRYKEEKAA